jgi:FK506-binding protein 1
MGVERELLSKGDGSSFPSKGDHLTMHYVGTLKDGTVFDSSRARGKPLNFIIGIGAVIRGWDEGVMLMSLGEKAILRITSDFAYGSQPPEGIPADADMDFEVELLSINDNYRPAGCCLLQ